MTQDPVPQTIATYNRIAEDYAARWQNRAVLAAAAAQFAELAGPHGRVLDVGCGAGFDTAVLRQHGLRAAGVDLSWGMMQAGRQRGLAVDFVQADMRALPFAAGLDGIWACASLLHVPRAQVPGVLHSFAALLRPGGVFYLSVKVGDDEAWTADKYGRQQYRFFTYWQPETLDPLLTAVGFQIVAGDVRPGKRDVWLSRLARKT
ncbi:MAG: class I SAM-dependent methyltransferase [Ardenticatenaceae bacterium]|nr:class I SAM-dependent methyltransferase [Ardenticatenaceae bacterium]